MPSPPRQERRITQRCPTCGDRQVQKETTIKGKVIASVWRCLSCKTRWPERRRAA